MQELVPQDASQLDPKVLKVMRAIRQVESDGNYNAVGDGGASKGAYQWNKDNFKVQATQFGLDPNDFSIANQNKVAYARIKSLKDQGRQPEEIAAIWNGAVKSPDGKYTYVKPEYGVKFRKALLGEQPSVPQNPSVESGFVQPPALQPIATEQQTSTPQTTNNGGMLSLLGGGVKKVAQGISEPLLGLAATPVQAGIAGYNALTGSHVQDPYKNGIPVAGLGQTDVTPLGLEQKAGDLAQVGSYFIPGSGLASAGIAGMLQGAGSSMSKGEDLGQVVGKGAIGAGLNVGTTLATQLAGKGIQYAGEKLSGEHVDKAVAGIKDAYGSALNLNAGERAFENRSGKDLAEVLTNNQVPLGRYVDGTLDASKAIPILQQKITPLSQEAESILSGSDATVNLIDAANKAKAGIAKKATTALDMRTATRDIDEYIQAEIEERASKLAQDTYGMALEKLSKQQQSKIIYDAANVPVLDADKIKTGFWNATFDKTRSDLHNHIPYQIGTSLKDAIEQAVPDSQLAVVNRELGDLIDATRRLTKMDGVKLLKGGRLGNIASGAIGALTGAAANVGPLGVLAGDYFGQKAAQFLQDPATKIAIAGYRAGAESAVPRLLGPASKAVGKAVSALGGGIAKTGRGAGLISNLLSK